MPGQSAIEPRVKPSCRQSLQAIFLWEFNVSTNYHRLRGVIIARPHTDPDQGFEIVDYL
jgi:hypothetical protein